MRIRIPKSRRNRLGLAFLACTVVLGGIAFGIRLGEWANGMLAARGIRLIPARPRFRWDRGIPVSKAPGPPRSEGLHFQLNADNSQLMIGMDDPQNERWCDVAGNYYTRQFVEGFSYVQSGEGGPRVRVAIEPLGVTLQGRLEARGLKPNFAYQIKLAGDFHRDREGFEAIGLTGRWRLPGVDTNYVDKDYFGYPEERKHLVDAYILFDYFVTDANGDAVRNFSLDSSLHVLWKLSQYSSGVRPEDLLEVTIAAEDPAIYARPKASPQAIQLWAEREFARYTKNDQVIRLPARHFKAALALTEESFHSMDTDGGWWASVATVPIAFEIVP